VGEISQPRRGFPRYLATLAPLTKELVPTG